MTRDTDRDWTKLATEHPYWAVLSVEEFRGEELDEEKKARFFQSGREQIARTINVVHRHFQSNYRIIRGLDFGCGVGRLLLPIAERADQAVGVDVAPDMRERCRRNLEAANLGNATVVASDDALSQVEGLFNFVNTVIVIQHIPPERGIRILARLLALIEPGGVGSIQFTYAKERRFFPYEVSRGRFYRRDGTTLHDLVPIGEEPPEGTITMFDYDLNQVMPMVAEMAAAPVLVLPTNDDGHIGVHLMFMRNRG